MALETTAEIGCDLRNRISSTIETVMFLNNPPHKYVAYVSDGGTLLTTWMGQKLGDVQCGRSYQTPAFDGFSSTRVPIRVKAINGCWYSGTYYKSSDDYARIRLTNRKGW